MGTLALIGLGSNLGDRKAYLDQAVATLAVTPGVIVRAVSSYHETAPVGGPLGQGAFLNAAARLDTDLDPHALLRILLDIEARAGRIRTVRWGERPLDLDLLIYGCKSLQTPELTLPHPRLGVRRFVLAPLVEIAPTIVDMRSGRTVEQLLAGLDRRPCYLAIDGPPGPFRDAIYDGILAGLPGVGLAEFAIPRVEGPVWLEASDCLRKAFSPRVRAAIRLLEAEHWQRTLNSWECLVSDFCLTSRALLRLGMGNHGLVDDHALRLALRTCPSLGHQLDSWLLPPTCIVGLPGGIFATRSLWNGLPFRTGTALLTPEATDPEGVVDEVLAAFAAS